jgi:hypothetical protein
LFIKPSSALPFIKLPSFTIKTPPEIESGRTVISGVFGALSHAENIAKQ